MLAQKKIFFFEYLCENMSVVFFSGDPLLFQVDDID